MNGTASRVHTFAWRFAIIVLFLGIASSLAIGALISVPNFAFLKLPIAAGIVLVAMLFLSPTSFLLVSFLFFATLQLVANYAYSVGPANFFLSDLFLGVITVRAISTRERRPMPRRLGRLTLGAFGAWASLMVIAMLRGFNHGAPLDSVVRYASPLFYWPVLYFGFSRVLREKGVDYARVLRGIVAISLALIAYMFFMHVLNKPFESPDSTRGHLGGVVSSSGQVFHRDFGFWSAYIVYPILALTALGKLLYARKGTIAWLAIAGVAILATLVTLIRSEIYGLTAGAAVLLLFANDAFARRRVGAGLSRFAAILMTGCVILLSASFLAAVDPGFAQVVAERSIPGYSRQSPGAQENAQYRLNALLKGTSVANHHVAGLGIISPVQLEERGIDTGYLVHSGPGTLLIFLGWPGLVAAALILVALGIDSSRARGRNPWLHPVLVGTLVMLVGNSFGAVGIVGQEFVMGIGALFIAFRFAAADAEPAV